MIKTSRKAITGLVALVTSFALMTTAAYAAAPPDPTGGAAAQLAGLGRCWPGTAQAERTAVRRQTVRGPVEGKRGAAAQAGPAVTAALRGTQ